MASKRSAGSDLNHMNWAEEQEPEEAGSFKKASEEALQKRVIKTAKRRNLATSNNEANAKNLFSSFSAFNKVPTTTSFAFLNNITAKEDQRSLNGISSSNNKSTDTQINNSSINNILSDEDEYYAKLKGLNESVATWIKNHVDSNPFINLKPIFKDYENYFDELETKSCKTAELNNQNKNDDFSKFKKELSSFSFKTTDLEKPICEKKLQFDSDLKKNENKGIRFTADSKDNATCSPTLKETENIQMATFKFVPNLPANVPTVSFTSKTEPDKNSFSFSGASPKPFAFTNVIQSTNNNEQPEENEDEPPKVEFTPVVEDGHTYTVKCKVFVKNQDTFGDRGVGVLYLKPVCNNDKTQLIVRADTNLGNLLCNFILSKNIPTKRVGKKDVMLVCLPTPESKPPPVPILLRVKSSEQADELLMELEKHKK